MDTASNITDSLDQADEEILTYTASDEALEAAAGPRLERVSCLFILTAHPPVEFHITTQLNLLLLRQPNSGTTVGRRQRGVFDMDNLADTLDQADEDLLTPPVSDDALEAAADTEKSPVATIVSFPCVCSG